jgi:hypothetical protein
MSDYEIRSMQTNLAHQFSAQHHSWFNFAIRPAQKCDNFYSQDMSCFDLLGLAYSCYLLRSQGLVTRSFVT